MHFLISSCTAAEPSHTCVSLRGKVVWMKPCFLSRIRATTSKRRCGDDPRVPDASFLPAGAGERAATRIQVSWAVALRLLQTKATLVSKKEEKNISSSFFPRWMHGVILCSRWVQYCAKLGNFSHKDLVLLYLCFANAFQSNCIAWIRFSLKHTGRFFGETWLNHCLKITSVEQAPDV